MPKVYYVLLQFSVCYAMCRLLPIGTFAVSVIFLSPQSKTSAALMKLMEMQAPSALLLHFDDSNTVM